MAKNRFLANLPSWTGTLSRSIAFCILTAGITLLPPVVSMAAWNQAAEQSTPANSYVLQNRPATILMAANENSEKIGTLSRKEKNADKKNVERWRELPSDEKKALRKKMDEWRNLTPQQQEKYRQRYEKLQKMPPKLRKKVDQGLQKLDTLSPKEKEEIRREFEK